MVVYVVTCENAENDCKYLECAFTDEQDALDYKNEVLYALARYYDGMPNVDIYYLKSENTKDLFGVYVLGPNLDESVYVKIIETKGWML